MFICLYNIKSIPLQRKACKDPSKPSDFVPKLMETINEFFASIGSEKLLDFYPNLLNSNKNDFLKELLEAITQYPFKPTLERALLKMPNVPPNFPPNFPPNSQPNSQPNFPFQAIPELKDLENIVRSIHNLSKTELNIVFRESSFRIDKKRENNQNEE